MTVKFLMTVIVVEHLINLLSLPWLHQSPNNQQNNNITMAITCLPEALQVIGTFQYQMAYNTHCCHR